MKDWFIRYHAYILSRGEQGSADVRAYMFVWLAPIAVAGVIDFLLRPDDVARLFVIVPAAVISLSGTIFVGVVYMTGFIRRERHESALRQAVPFTKRYPHLLATELLAAYPRPENNRPEALAIALAQVAVCTWKTESQVAAGKLMCAIGDDNRGDYRPVVLLALPVLADRLSSDNRWAQFAVTRALSKLWFSRHPEPGFEMFQAPGADIPVPVEVDVHNAVRNMLPAIDEIARGKGPAAPHAVRLAEALRSPETR